MAQPESPKRVQQLLFRSDMLHPSFGGAATALVAMLLVEKLAQDHVVPHFLESLGAGFAARGRVPAALWYGEVIAAVAFWGLGGLMMLPALLRVKAGKIQAKRDLNARALLRSMPLIVFNHFFGSFALFLGFALLLPESAFDFRPSALPSAAKLARDVVVWLVVEEVLFFYVHKFLHENKRAYAAIHKLHHQWTAPVAWCAVYAHPVEVIFGNLMPLLAGPVLAGSHFTSVLIYLFAGLIHTQAVHSGYWICDDHGMHDEHHARFNVNYGVTGLLDLLHGTYAPVGGGAAAAKAAA